MLEFPCFEPVEYLRVDCRGLFSCEIGTVLEVIVLSLLLCLQIQPRQSTKVLLADSFVDSSSAANTLSIVVRGIGPPISLGLDIADDHILNRYGQAWDLPRDIGLPAAPCLTQMLQDGLRLVCFHTLRHHVVNVFNHC